ncbi:hypothetical protein LUZ60_013439 [Juncus effusus]|nr:hypothetical protein LUZ60_013439 [Juncus effusus]
MTGRTGSCCLVRWFNTKIKNPFIEILTRGTEPKELAFSAALGLTLGVFPICGVTVVLCAIAIAVLGKRCNPATVVLANFIATPIELIMLVPFLRLGEFISGSAHFPLTSDALKEVLTGHASKELLMSIVHALLGWFIATPFILAILYVIFLPCFTLLVRRFRPDVRPSSPTKQVLLPL